VAVVVTVPVVVAVVVAVMAAMAVTLTVVPVVATGVDAHSENLRDAHFLGPFYCYL
jgi:hypothetical protein